MATRVKNNKNNNKNYIDIIEEEKKNNCSALNFVDVSPITTTNNNLVEELKKIEQKYITENKINSLYNSVNSSCDINDYNYYNYSSIYKIINKIDDKILYIGSISVDIKERINGHNNGIKYKNSKIYKKIRKIGNDNIEFQVIEEFYCFNEKQLHQREFNWINYYFPKYNSQYNLSKYIIINGYECIEKKNMTIYSFFNIHTCATNI